MVQINTKKVLLNMSTPYITNMISNVAYVGKEYIFVPRIVGGNTENLSVSIQEGPSWMAVDENGFVVGIPTIQDIGTYRVILTVSDGTLSSDLVDYVIVE
ncbi:MAG: Serine protease [candidate division WS6 bacterium GW2011_GWD1_35_594]|nr:MAG: Serine protease [candidate division WS6 bacterium GW2011_GWD1_35_594]